MILGFNFYSLANKSISTKPEFTKKSGTILFHLLALFFVFVSFIFEGLIKNKIGDKRMKSSDLKDDEYRDYYGIYISKAPDVDLNAGLENGGNKFIEFIKSIPQEKLEYRYEKGKWTIKEVIQHLIDSERIFSFRAFHFARGDKSPLPGFTQDDYVNASNANSKTIEQLTNEYEALGGTTLSLFKSFSSEMLLSKGILYETPMSARAAGFIIIGHEIYHQKIIEERYL